MKTKLRNLKGFTIIEVLIVLAIAGLILLIIFLAVPALQRNSRNTQMRNDASVLLGYFNDYAANNGGGLPTVVGYTSTTGAVTFATAGTCAVPTSPQPAGNIRAGVTVNCGAVQPATAGTLTINIGAICNGNVLGGAANPRAVAIGFKTETAGGTSDQCMQS